jgi:hypothetical protein
VLRHRGLRDPESSRELTDSVLSAPQALEKGTSRRVGQGRESFIVSHGLYKYQRMLRSSSRTFVIDSDPRIHGVNSMTRLRFERESDVLNEILFVPEKP